MVVRTNSIPENAWECLYESHKYGIYGHIFKFHKRHFSWCTQKSFMQNRVVIPKRPNKLNTSGPHAHKVPYEGFFRLFPGGIYSVLQGNSVFWLPPVLLLLTCSKDFHHRMWYNSSVVKILAQISDSEQSLSRVEPWNAINVPQYWFPKEILFGFCLWRNIPKAG